MNEPKPCPICGYIPDLKPYGLDAGNFAGRYHARDPNCEVAMPPEDTRDEAARCWNRYYVEPLLEPTDV